QFDVVAGGEGIGLQLAGGREQFVELDLLVARYARDWRPPRRIAVNERLHDGRPKALLVIEHVVGDAKPVGATAGGVGVPARAAPVRRRPPGSPRWQSWGVTPMTSHPCCWSNAATTAESTPPDMATPTRRGRREPVSLGDPIPSEIGLSDITTGVGAMGAWRL